VSAQLAGSRYVLSPTVTLSAPVTPGIARSESSQDPSAHGGDTAASGRDRDRLSRALTGLATACVVGR